MAIQLIALTALSLSTGAPAQSAEVRRFDLLVEGGTLTGSDKTIRITQGDRVELRWASDQPLEIHMHGYDLEITVGPGAPATMDFDAHATGRFPFEGHIGHKNRVLLYLEVYPR
jgi:hypothetical protein